MFSYKANFKNYIEIGRKIKEIVNSFDPNAKLYIFGSAVKGKNVASSDIDVLIITEKIELKYEIMVKVFKSIDEPIELHIITREIFDKWYRRFIPIEELVEI
ncbi:nucleotidyltransferase domain-containing protein [Fervidicoccus fontis]|uniref:DNA polymerase III subunit beta n=1 Tax=Fervidicoccus fontis TaxID=683846 RepID=A0A2J6N466_9CREN|nr:nucleotidyltransferase domain-containing protein [Fervidicoccus fontis]PMB76003.1 MAG: DNA polymerase III subunit beta [Fervidicoccus fontis]PMB77127.1 MAG: DNA polymerase III subunit beta [Fervidicoccus fontis]HEW64328.1 nucleotidyltransferase domain-containing protein [Fervidicoccus fontis]